MVRIYAVNCNLKTCKSVESAKGKPFEGLELATIIRFILKIIIETFISSIKIGLPFYPTTFWKKVFCNETTMFLN